MPEFRDPSPPVLFPRVGSGTPNRCFSTSSMAADRSTARISCGFTDQGGWGRGHCCVFFKDPSKLQRRKRSISDHPDRAKAPRKAATDTAKLRHLHLQCMYLIYDRQLAWMPRACMCGMRQPVPLPTSMMRELASNPGTLFTILRSRCVFSMIVKVC